MVILQHYNMAKKAKGIAIFFRKLKDLKIRKSSIWIVVTTMSIAAVGWLMFLVFFGRVSPIIKDTTEKNFKLYSYSLVTLPFWVYAFLAPLLYPPIALYILNGHWILGMIAQISSAALAFLLGALLNMSAAVIHVIRNLDHNTVTRNICIVGMIGVVLSLLNLVALLVVMQMYEKWTTTKSIKSMVKNIEVTLPRDSFDNSDEEIDMGGYYGNVQAPIYDTVEGVEDEMKQAKKNKKRYRK